MITAREALTVRRGRGMRERQSRITGKKSWLACSIKEGERE